MSYHDLEILLWGGIGDGSHHTNHQMFVLDPKTLEVCQRPRMTGSHTWDSYIAPMSDNDGFYGWEVSDTTGVKIWKKADFTSIRGIKNMLSKEVFYHKSTKHDNRTCTELADGGCIELVDEDAYLCIFAGEMSIGDAANKLGYEAHNLA